MKLHIHSDNAGWAGSENMVGVFLSSKEINKEFDVSFSYRQTKEYEEGMKKWVPDLYKSDCELCDNKVCSGAGKEPLKTWFPCNCLRIDPVRRPDLHPIKFWVTTLYRIRKWFKPIMVFKYFCMIQEIWELYKLFIKLEPDILHINNGGYFGATSCNSAAIAGKLAGITGITYMINSTATSHWWEKPITWKVRKSVDRFISASEHLKMGSKFLWFLNSFPFWRVIPNTLREDIKPRFTVEETRRSLNAEGKVLFVACGEDAPRKGFNVLKTAFEKVNDGNAVLFISHNGEDTYDLINACDWLVVPSLYDEDFPNVILIARKYNKPVIATDVGGIREMATVVDYLIPPGSVDDLRYAILEIIHNLGQVPIKDQPINKWSNDYQPSIVINKYLDLWKGLAE